MLDSDIDASVARHYKSGKRRLTKDQAIRVIRRVREKQLFAPGRFWSEHERKLRVYTRGLTYELIRCILASQEEDPVRIIYTFVHLMNDILEETESLDTIYFTDYMIEAAEYILEWIG